MLQRLERNIEICATVSQVKRLERDYTSAIKWILMISSVLALYHEILSRDMIMSRAKFTRHMQQDRPCIYRYIHKLAFAGLYQIIRSH